MPKFNEKSYPFRTHEPTLLVEKLCVQQGILIFSGWKITNNLFTRFTEVGQDTVVQSGLHRQTADSLKHIKNLYDETKYLKNYLDKVHCIFVKS